jgi:hypothetical protein
MLENPGGLKLEILYQDFVQEPIDIFLSFDGMSHPLSPMSPTHPFMNLLDFMRALHTQRLPYRVTLYEEGPGTVFEAWPVAEDSPNFHLYVYYEENGHRYPWINARLERRAVIDIFLEALEDMVAHTDQDFQAFWNINQSDLEKFRQLLLREVPSRSAPKPDPDYSFTFSAVVTIKLFDFFAACWLLNQYATFWPYWFSLLEKILLSNLPAHFKFHDFSDNRLFIEDDNDMMVGYLDPARYTISAIPVDDPRHFRLRAAQFDSNGEWLIMDEVFDRVSFGRAFCRDFELYLKNDYTFQPRGDERDFDLRTLPIDRLKSLLP